jgi:membrane protease YdiL (CAAX protease family)
MRMARPRFRRRFEWSTVRLGPSIVRSSLIGYGILFAMSLVLACWQGRLVSMFTLPVWPRTATNVLIGVLIAVAVLSGARAMRGTFQWAKRLEEEFRFLLAPLDLRGILVLAVSSGIAEETFFRAIMQPVLGLWITSLVFGLLHYPVNRRLIPWTISAIALGFVFGLVYQATGSLLAVALGHGLINFFELRHVAESCPPDAPSL